MCVCTYRWVGEQHLTRPAGIRHKMLMSRQKNPVLFSGVGWNPIPLIESEINDDDMLNKVCGLKLLGYAALSRYCMQP
jgi:hypothetical protein